MKTTDVQREVSKLNLPDEQKSAILALIDLKTDSDMKEVISEISRLRADMDAKFSGIDSKFKSIDVQLRVLFWLIGFLIVLVSIYRFLE